MSDSMIDRVARSMARESGWRWDVPLHMVDVLASGENSARSRDTWRKRAQAVLTDMREPTAAILRAMRDTVPVDGHEWEFLDDEAIPHWQAMIDAALAEDSSDDRKGGADDKSS